MVSKSLDTSTNVKSRRKYNNRIHLNRSLALLVVIDILSPCSLLEAQIATGGIIDLRSPVRISVSVAQKRNLLDLNLAKKLEKRETASYFDPVTGENLNYSELMGRWVSFFATYMKPRSSYRSI